MHQHQLISFATKFGGFNNQNASRRNEWNVVTQGQVVQFRDAVCGISIVNFEFCEFSEKPTPKPTDLHARSASPDFA
jgi:hypothetical protein